MESIFEEIIKALEEKKKEYSNSQCKYGAVQSCIDEVLLVISKHIGDANLHRH